MKRRSSVWLIVAVFIMSAIGSECRAEAAAFRPPGDRAGFAVSSGTRDETFAKIAYNSRDNEYLVVWNDYEEAALFAQGLVHGQLLSAAGELLGSEIAISVDNPEVSRLLPHVCYSPEFNEYLVVFTMNWDLYGRFVAADGSLKGKEFVICQGPRSQMHSMPLFNPRQHNYFVVWNDSRNGSNETDIYGAFVTTDGTVEGDVFPVCDAPKDQINPTMTYNDDDDEFLVVWEDMRTCTTDPCYEDLCNIYGQRVSSSGALEGDNIVVANGLHDQRMQHAMYNPNTNQYIVIYFERPQLEEDWGEADVYGTFVSSGGETADDRLAVCTAPGHQLYSTLTYNAAEKAFLVVWSDYRGLDDIFDSDISSQHIYDPGSIYGLWLNAEGRPLGDEFIVCAESTGMQMLAYTASNTVDKNCIVMWTDTRNVERGFDVYGEIIDPPCPAMYVVNDSNTLQTLRGFRDRVLARSAAGRAAVRLYYRYATRISSMVRSSPVMMRTAGYVVETIADIVAAQ